MPRYVKELEGLLLAAMNDLKTTTIGCRSCIHIIDGKCPMQHNDSCSYKWRYYDKAYKLLGKEHKNE